jgi:hypothetical protein
MRRFAALAFMSAIAAAPSGCIIESNSNPPPPPDTFHPDAVWVIQNKVMDGAGLAYNPGQDAGYYLAYMTGGHWRVDWTCDSTLSSASCHFQGSIKDSLAHAFSNVTGWDCPNGPTSCVGTAINTGTGSTELDFDQTVGATAATEYQYLTFDSAPGDILQMNLLLDNMPATDEPNANPPPATKDLVYWPNNGVQSPTTDPFYVEPTTP